MPDKKYIIIYISVILLVFLSGCEKAESKLDTLKNELLQTAREISNITFSYIDDENKNYENIFIKNHSNLRKEYGFHPENLKSVTILTDQFNCQYEKYSGIFYVRNIKPKKLIYRENILLILFLPHLFFTDDNKIEYYNNTEFQNIKCQKIHLIPSRAEEKNRYNFYFSKNDNKYIGVEIMFEEEIHTTYTFEKWQLVNSINIPTSIKATTQYGVIRDIYIKNIKIDSDFPSELFSKPDENKWITIGYSVKKKEEHEKILVNEPNNINSLYILSGIYSNFQEYNKSEELLIRLTNILPDNMAVINSLAKLYTNILNKIDKAILLYEKAIALEKNPNVKIEYFNRLAKAYLKKGEYNSAEKYFKKVIDLALSVKMDRYTQLIDIAYAYNNIGRLDTALTLFEQTLQPFKNNIDIILVLAHSYKLKPEYQDKSILMLEAATALKPDSFSLINELANQLQAANKIDKTLQVYKQILEKYNWNRELHIDLLMRFLYKNNAMQKGITFLKDFINNHPEFIHSYMTLGKIFTVNQEYQKAIDWYNKAVKIETEQKARADIYVKIARNYSTLKEYDKALDAINKAAELNKDYISAKENYIEMYKKNKN